MLTETEKDLALEEFDLILSAQWADEAKEGRIYSLDFF